MIPCAYVDECKTDFKSCHQKALCHNTQGSFTCSCKPGYNGDGYKCTGKILWKKFNIYYHSDADECLNNSHNCSENATCTNTEGSFNCSCTLGYIVI
ncbi:unnamed protein product [Porites evermanni]|uniref:EGF-like domain-containing protein n=1 Tax=Porites evermanni TaxID=104178 RepID=A0ABN8R1T1_9CNID|nr:unnamed protein product [Porites evermanni]